MKKIIYILTLFLSFSCGDRPKQIPEKELGDIIIQSILTESFLRQTNKLNYHDTIDFYLPILDQYGYTSEDVDYTIERMIQRKSNVFGELMERISVEVGNVKEHYEYLSNMGRNWREKVRNEVFDTLYFSPDSIRVRSIAELKNLDFRVPINSSGEVVVKYNYKINSSDSNSTRYFVYSIRDSVSGKREWGNNYWLSKSDNIKPFEKDILIKKKHNINMLDIRIMSYTSKEETPHKNYLKSIDFYIDSVTILMRPQYDIADKILLKRVGGLNFATDFYYLFRDTMTNPEIPFTLEYSKPVYYHHDSVRYHHAFPMGEDPKVAERKRVQEQRKMEAERKANEIKRKKAEAEQRKAAPRADV